MEDISKSINDFLASPDAMAQIQNALSMLGSGDQTGKQQDATNEPSSADTGQNGGLGGLDLGSLLNGLNLNDVTKMTGLLSSMGGGGDDPKINLLMALKPYLSGKRSAKIDTAIKILQISKYSPILKELL